MPSPERRILPAIHYQLVQSANYHAPFVGRPELADTIDGLGLVAQEIVPLHGIAGADAA
jgi:hypothetical protein